MSLLRFLPLALMACGRPSAAAQGPRMTEPPSPCHPTPPPEARFAVTVLGSGGPSSAGRAASSYVVWTDGMPRILVDLGPGSFARLGEMSVNAERLDTVLLTHLHIDHAGELPGFVKSRDLSFNQRPMTFRIFGPSGARSYPSTTTFVDRVFGQGGAFAYLQDFHNHLDFEVTDLPTAQDAPVHEVLRGDDLRVSSIAVDHGEAPAVAYRVDRAGHSAVFSGDLASKNDNLVRLADGANLLVYDTTVFDPPGSAKPLYDLHTTPSRIGEVASAAGVGSVLLSHVATDVDRRQDEVLRSVRARFGGDVRFAEDCMTVVLVQ
jgi:ribonuclease BN (tRNA processing enzyme)